MENGKPVGVATSLKPHFLDMLHLMIEVEKDVRRLYLYVRLLSNSILACLSSHANLATF